MIDNLEHIPGQGNLRSIMPFPLFEYFVFLLLFWDGLNKVIHDFQKYPLEVLPSIFIQRAMVYLVVALADTRGESPA